MWSWWLLTPSHAPGSGLQPLSLQDWGLSLEDRRHRMSFFSYLVQAYLLDVEHCSSSWPGIYIPNPVMAMVSPSSPCSWKICNCPISPHCSGYAPAALGTIKMWGARQDNRKIESFIALPQFPVYICFFPSYCVKRGLGKPYKNQITLIQNTSAERSSQNNFSKGDFTQLLHIAFLVF